MEGGVLFISFCLFLVPLKLVKADKNCSENGVCIYQNENIPQNCINYTDILLTKEEKSYIVRTHNILRENLTSGAYENIPKALYIKKITWNETLAKEARDSTKQCKGPRNVTSGRNVAIGEDGKYRKITLKSLIQTWLDGVYHLTPEIIVNYRDPKKDDFDFTPATQMIWWNTTQVGCGRFVYKVNNCSNDNSLTCFDGQTMTELVCNYFPAGNKLGHPVYTNEFINELLCRPDNPNFYCLPLNESDYKTGEEPGRRTNLTYEYRHRSRMIELWPAINGASPPREFCFFCGHYVFFSAIFIHLFMIPIYLKNLK